VWLNVVVDELGHSNNFTFTFRMDAEAANKIVLTD
jgi:hypothetical protein